MIQTLATATPRCTCKVDLLSKVFRPYNFLVTVTGQFPHAFTRRYHIGAPTDDAAALFGMHLFVKECMAEAGVPAAIRADMAPPDPKAKLLQ
jgi:hypothetical protein